MWDFSDPGGRIVVSLENVQRNVRVEAACCDFNSASPLMCSELVSQFLQVAKVSVNTGGRSVQLPFIPSFCDQVADQRLHPWHQFTETWRVSTMIIITFSIISIISITLLLIFRHCLSSKSSLESVFKLLWKSSSAFQMHLPQQVTGWRSEAEVFCPGGTATSNSNTLCVMPQKCTWKGFCFSKNAHVLSDQTRLLMFPCVQSSWTSERWTYLLWTVSS